LKNVNSKKEKEKMKKWSIMASLLMVLAFTTLVMAGSGYRFFDGKGHLDPAVIAALELTSEQTEKVQALHETARKQMVPLKAQFATKRAEMKLLWTQTALDVDKIKATQKELQALGTQMRDLRTDMRIAFRKLLTPEQTERLLAMGFGKHGRYKKGGGYAKGKRGGYGKGQKRGDCGQQCSDCPRYRQ
jgi:Spy/CpxP family protein refolding chaperone